jgi:general secretion pathway protein H
MTPTSVTKPVAGFTLLELILVLLILGLASALIAPNLSGSESRNFNAQVREATSLLNYARRIAVVKGLPGKAVFHTTADSAYDSDSLPARSATTASWTSRGIELEYRDSTHQLVDAADVVEVIFYPEGGSTGGEITLRQGSRQAVLRIDPFSGRVSTQLNAN